MEVFEF